MVFERFRGTCLYGILAACLMVGSVPAAQEAEQSAASSEEASPAKAGDKLELQRWSKDADLWVDRKHKLVVMDGEVCLREGQLEMFACPKGTKEHEAIVAVHCRAQDAHAALLVVGAKPGRPVRFAPSYQPAAGTEIEVRVLWRDAKGKTHKIRAQQWIKQLRTGKAMTYPWVFAGSGFWTDPDTGKRYYQAEGGDFICVSNFPTATLDLPVESSQSNEDLLFAAFTERIPPVGTKVKLVLIPQLGGEEQERRKPGDPS